MSKTDSLIKRMSAAGFAGGFVRTCLPDWWDEQAEQSESAWLQLQLDLAQRFSIDPLTVIDESAPLQFSDVGSPKFKHLALTEAQQGAVNGFANGLARLLLAATPRAAHPLPVSALELRSLVLADSAAPWIGFGELLQLCLAFGIPVAHLTVFPAGIKGMAAMTLTVDQRPVILTARKPTHPAQVAFYLAHELGHVALGHLRDGKAIIEGVTLDPAERDDGLPVDDEETQADQFAFELLTGTSDLKVTSALDRGTAAELHRVATQTGASMHVDPGLIILCYGRSTGRWPLAVKALSLLPDHDQEVGALINRALRSQLDGEMLSSADVAYLDAVAAP